HLEGRLGLPAPLAVGRESARAEHGSEVQLGVGRETADLVRRGPVAAGDAEVEPLVVAVDPRTSADAARDLVLAVAVVADVVARVQVAARRLVDRVRGVLEPRPVVLDAAADLQLEVAGGTVHPDPVLPVPEEAVVVLLRGLLQIRHALLELVAGRVGAGTEL